jgi:hypothetical protein
MKLQRRPALLQGLIFGPLTHNQSMQDAGEAVAAEQVTLYVTGAWRPALTRRYRATRFGPIPPLRDGAVMRICGLAQPEAKVEIEMKAVLE